MSRRAMSLLLLFAVVLVLGSRRFALKTPHPQPPLPRRGHSSTSRWTARTSRATRGSSFSVADLPAWGQADRRPPEFHWRRSHRGRIGRADVPDPGGRRPHPAGVSTGSPSEEPAPADTPTTLEAGDALVFPMQKHI